MRILIVGAGVGGLTLAALLRQRGLSPDIIDGAPSFAARGYPLALHTMGSRVLHGLGVHRAFTNISAPLGNDMRILDRTELVSLLSRAAQQPEIRHNTSVASLDTDQSHAILSDGAEDRYDLIVGVDGARSRIRELIGAPIDHFRAKWTCLTWWSKQDPVETEIFEHTGNRRFVGLYPAHTRTAVIAAAPSRMMQGDGEQRKERMTRAFRKVEGSARTALESLPGDVFWSPLSDSLAGHWRKGRVVLLGDAACTFVPLAKIGAAVAMESAAVLADELSRAGSRDIPAALAAFEKRRRARIEVMLSHSRKLARHIVGGHDPISWVRRKTSGILSPEDFARRMAAMLAEPI